MYNYIIKKGVFMKLIYGNNGAGKTHYKEQKQKEGAIVLTSHIDDWTTSQKISTRTFNIGQNVNLIAEDKLKIRELVNGMYNNLGITKAK